MDKSDQCPSCGLVYAQFRTGFTFQDIVDMFWVTTNDSTQWKYKRRHAILGRWHQIKLEMWDQHLSGCEGHTVLESLPVEGY